MGVYAYGKAWKGGWGAAWLSIRVWTGVVRVWPEAVRFLHSDVQFCPVGQQRMCTLGFYV